MPELVNLGSVVASSADGAVRLDVASPLVALLTGERGGDAAGSWVRFENGLQVCWATRTLLFASIDYVQDTWVFPKQFLEPAVALCSVRDVPVYAGNITLITLVRAVPTATTALFRVYRLGGQANFVAGDSVIINALAVGRWK